MKSLATPAVAAFMMATAGTAATLTGDTITFDAPGATFASNDLIGAGVDWVDGTIEYDLDYGIEGDQLRIDTGSGCGEYACSGVTTLTFSDLDFSGGALLVGFNILSEPQLDVTALVIDGSTLQLSYTEGTVVPGNFLVGEYVFDTAPVPLPAGAALLLEDVFQNHRAAAADMQVEKTAFQGSGARHVTSLRQSGHKINAARG